MRRVLVSCCSFRNRKLVCHCWVPRSCSQDRSRPTSPCPTRGVDRSRSYWCTWSWYPQLPADSHTAVGNDRPVRLSTRHGVVSSLPSSQKHSQYSRRSAMAVASAAQVSYSCVSLLSCLRPASTAPPSGPCALFPHIRHASGACIRLRGCGTQDPSQCMFRVACSQPRSHCRSSRHTLPCTPFHGR